MSLHQFPHTQMPLEHRLPHGANQVFSMHDELGTDDVLVASIQVADLPVVIADPVHIRPDILGGSDSRNDGIRHPYWLDELKRLHDVLASLKGRSIRRASFGEVNAFVQTLATATCCPQPVDGGF